MGRYYCSNFERIIGVVLALSLSSVALAAPPQNRESEGPTKQSESKVRRLDVKGLEERYWNSPGGETSEMKVIQNRMYSKSGKPSFVLHGGSFSGDPFLTSWTYGASIGMNFSESLGIHAYYTRFSSGFNSSYDTLIATTRTLTSATVGPNSNEPNYLFGGEASWSVFYGKLSLEGLAIIHFDTMIRAGAGSMLVKTGATRGEQEFTTIAYWPGISLMTYLKTWMGLSLDYRLFFYSSDVVERNAGAANEGVRSKTQLSISPLISLGLNFYI